MRFTTLPTAILGLAFVVVTSVSMAADEVDALREKASLLRREEKASLLRRESAALFEKGHKEEAEKMFRAASELAEQAERHEATHASESAKHKVAVTDQIRDLQSLKERLLDLRTAQKTAKEKNASEQEVHEIREQITQTERKLAQRLAQGRPASPEHTDMPPQFRALTEKLEVATRRMQHVRVAAENLKAAEMHDMAHELTQRAQAMEQEIHAAKLEIEKARPEREGQAHEHKAENPELRAENEQLRRELNELRMVVERLRSASEKKQDVQFIEQ